MNVDLDHAPEGLLNKPFNVFSPVVERHQRQIFTQGDYTVRDIKKGEEIFCNYLKFIGNTVEWKEEVER